MFIKFNADKIQIKTKIVLQPDRQEKQILFNLLKIDLSMIKSFKRFLFFSRLNFFYHCLLYFIYVKWHFNFLTHNIIRVIDFFL